MQIIHTVTLHGTEGERFQQLGIAMVRINPGTKLTDLLQFKIAEDDPRWKQTQALIKELRVVDFSETRFTPDELSRARFLAMHPSWHHGYPQPEDDFGYLKVTYDLSDYCSACGAGARQAAPFRMTKPPAWGKKSVLQLNWIFDEYFVKPETCEKVFNPFAIKCRPVLQHRSGKEIDSVVQLDISERPRAVDGFLSVYAMFPMQAKSV